VSGTKPSLINACIELRVFSGDDKISERAMLAPGAGGPRRRRTDNHFPHFFMATANLPTFFDQRVNIDHLAALT
jgi:hypothetical protein